MDYLTCYCSQISVQNCTGILFLFCYRLKEPILHLLWGLVDMFFGYNFLKPEPIWKKFGLETVSVAEPLQNRLHAQNR